ncbi:hypothetical protein BKA61DRAFT_260254 [Leptodontidium sp. MPI-SDFR-AT-0119]|nr:hypothetical protein BKA61DRAFT_260254 [Leptodontidium sp. MPI-SDFR-AT-0119]
MRWVLNFSTTREEDQAYCFLSIFDVSMSLIYGEERQKAFRRLEKGIEESAKLEKTSNSQQLETISHGPSELDLSRTREYILSSIFYSEHAARRENVNIGVILF